MKLKHLFPALCLFALAAGLLAQAPQAAATGAKPVTVFVVRHAEKAPAAPGERDPELSAAGEARAQDLARLLGAAGITDVFCTEFVRTRATAAPLAEALELEVRAVSAGELEEQAALLRALEPGSVALVAGHSNTVPQLVAELGGEVGELVEHPRYGGTLADDQYDRLFVVTLPVDERGETQTIELRYGALGSDGR